MPEIKVQIDAEGNAAQVANTAKEAIKGVTDESARYQQVLEKMANGDADAAQAKRFAEVRAQAQAYIPVAQAAAEAEKTRAEAAAKLEEQLKNLKHSWEEEGGANEASEGHAQGTRRLFTELNKIVPELGHALHEAFMGPIGAVIMLTTAVADAYSTIAEFNAKLDEMAKQNASADFMGSITAQLQVFTNAAAEAQAFADALQNITTNSNTLNTQLQDQLSLYQAIERAQAGLVSAQKGLAIAEIQRDEAAHKITPEQAAERRAKAEKDALEAEQKARDAAQDTELNAKQATLKKAKADQARLEGDAAIAAEQVDADKKHSEVVKLDPAEQIKKIQELRERMNHIQELETRYDKGTMTDAGEIGTVQGARKFGTVERIQQQIGQLEKQLQQYNADQNKAAGKKADEDAAAEAKRKAEENKKLTEDLTRSIAELAKQIAATRPIEHQATGTREAAVDAQEQGRILGDFEKDFNALERFGRNKNPTAAAIEKAAKAMRDVLDMLRDHADLIGTLPDHDAEIKAIKSDIEKVKAQLGNNKNFGTTQF